MAVISLLKGCGASEKLTMLITGPLMSVSVPTHVPGLYLFYLYIASLPLYLSYVSSYV